MEGSNFIEKYERSQKNYKENRDRYLPIIETFVENFLAAFIEPSKYYQEVKLYISLQIRQRLKYFILGLLFLFISFYFIFFFLGFLFLASYNVLLNKIHDNALIAFFLGWISFLFFFIIIYLSFHYFNKIGQKIPITRRK
jgi:hypothetical protein